MKKILGIICCAIIFCVSSCGSSSNDGSNNIKNIRESVKKNQQEITIISFTKYKIPLPIDMFRYMENKHVPCNVEFLLDYVNVPKYKTETSQALALGCYAADAAYCSVYGKQQEITDYYQTATKLSDKLDISEGFSMNEVHRIEENLQCADSLSKIANDSYWNACNYLEENGKNNILPFVVFGSWIESVYIMTTLCDISDAQNKIKEHQESLTNLMNYLYEVMIESSAFNYNYDIKRYQLKLAEIKKIYDSLNNDDTDIQKINEIIRIYQNIRSEIIKAN